MFRFGVAAPRALVLAVIVVLGGLGLPRISSAGEPCCGITAIDTRTGIVTAREIGSKRTFQFEVKNAALLRSLKVGQPISVDFGTRKVSVDSAAPCCNITSVQP